VSYLALLKSAWKSGEFKIFESDAAKPDVDPELSWKKVQKEIEEIIEREAGDAASCLNVHREGIMKLAPFVKFREEKFGAVLFETRSEKVYTLSPTGAAVVREVIAGAESGNLVAKLKEKFEDPTGKMATEAETFLAELKTKGLIVE
jgi:hypothetical protein